MDQISETTPLLFSDFEFPHENLRSETFLRTDRFAKKKVAVGKKEIATFRERVAYFVDNSSIRLWWQFADAILNAIFVGLYVWCTEYEQIEKHKPKVHPPDALLQADIVFAFLIFVQWVPRVYFSVNVQREFFSFHTVVSVLATWSVLIVALWRFLQDDDYCDSYMCAGKLIYIYPFRFLRLHLSLVRVLKPSRGFLDLSIPFNRVVRKAAQVIVTIVNTLATVAAWVHLTLYIQQGFKDLSFFDVFYSLTVSSVSGLQTDIIADNPVSRIVILYVMIVGAIFIPSNLAELFDLMKFQSKYDKAFRPVQAERQSHVLVVGNVSYPLLVDFLKEFFCDDHGVETMNTQVVILSPVQPDEDTQILLQDPLYMSRVQYVKGSPRNFNHLQRARADIAKACFILATKSGVKDPAEDDAYSVMIALTIKKFQPNVKLFVQVLLPQNKIHFENLADHILCVDEYKMGILGQNAVAPGINSIIYLLMTTIPEESALTLESSLDRPIETWAREFAEGAMMEIYQTTISTSFAGLTFGDLSLRWYQNTGSLIFALGLKDPKIVDKDVDVDGVKIIFNPYEYVLDGGEIAYAFVRTAKLADEIRTSEGVEIDGSVPDIIPISKVSSQSSNISIPEVDSTTILSSSAKFEEPMNGSMSDATEGSSAKKISIQVPTRKVENLETNSALSYAMFSGSGNVESVLGPGQFDASSELPATVKDHVVICDYDPDEYPPNLSFFIAPIRVKGSAPVVILSPVKPSHDEWKKLSAYGNVYHVRGKPLSRADLKKARVSKASQVVLLSNERSSSIDGADADASTILSILNIETLTSESKRKPPFLTFEVSRPESLKLIGDGDDYYNHQLHGQSLIPAFVAGHIFRPSIFQSVLVQAYYQPHLLHILRHFIFNLSSAAVKRSISQSEQRLEKRESQARRKFKFFGGSPREDRPHIDVDKPLPESNLPKPHGDVYKVAVPMSLKGSKYSSLVKYLLEKEGALAFALYRAYTNTNQEEAISKRLSGLQGLASEIRRRMTGEKDDDDDDDEEEKAVRYAVLNPRPDTRLKAFDYVFVFASKVPTFGART